MVAKSTLLYLSRSESLKRLLTRFDSFKRLTWRFVAGEHLEDAIEAIRALNKRGMTASFDHLGESITNVNETRKEVDEYLKVFTSIHQTGIDSNASVKLTQLGLDIDPELCYRNTRALVEAASRYSNFVRIDMEDSPRTDATLDIFYRIRKDFQNVGIVIQSYLYRSGDDVKRLLDSGARVRLCKGAYDEPESVAFPNKSDVDANYIALMKVLLTSGIYHGIATHDEKMIAATKEFAASQGISNDSFEFQMLYGVRRDLQDRLVREGYRMRVYVPYGDFWYPYFMRRLAERPANVWFVLKNLIRG